MEDRVQGIISADLPGARVVPGLRGGFRHGGRRGRWREIQGEISSGKKNPE